MIDGCSVRVQRTFMSTEYKNRHMGQEMTDIFHELFRTVGQAKASSVRERARE